MSWDTGGLVQAFEIPISHLHGLLRDASMLPRQQSFSLKSFLVRDFSCPSCDPAVVIHLHLDSFQFRFPFSSRVTLLFFVHELLRTFQIPVSRSQRWIEWNDNVGENNLIAFLFRSFAHSNFPLGPFSNFDSRKTSSLSQIGRRIAKSIRFRSIASFPTTDFRQRKFFFFFLPLYQHAAIVFQ